MTAPTFSAATPSVPPTYYGCCEKLRPLVINEERDKTLLIEDYIYLKY